MFYLSGCSKCDKEFKRDENNQPNYGGYNTESWTARKGDHHKEKGEEWLNGKNKSEREKLEFDEGVRYSELFRLPYYDPIRMHVIDPMHNLMLGLFSRYYQIISFFKV